MSRVGRAPITVPKGVEISWDAQEARVKGPKGSLAARIPDPRIVLEREGDILRVQRRSEDKKVRAFHGLVNRLVTNMIIGVTVGFRKELELRGVGYRAASEGGKLVLQLGFSHPVVFEPPAGVKIETPSQTSIVVTGIDKQAVGQVAANIRGYRPPEPYKGKGARYVGEYVRMLEGKKAAAKS
jgi:large subunit ribosomal protein L6